MSSKLESIKVIAASLLGDASLEKGYGANRQARFRISQIEQHKDHLDYIAPYIETFTSYHYYTRNCAGGSVIKGKNVTLKNSITLSSKVHPVFTRMYNRMYGTGKKCVDPHYLTLIDAQFLAVWFQQDGYMDRPTDAINPTPQPKICTDSFSYADCMSLRVAIIEKTGFIFNTHKRKTSSGALQYRLALSRKQTNQFIEYIAPYVQPSFKYKLELTRQSISSDI